MELFLWSYQQLLRAIYFKKYPIPGYFLKIIDYCSSIKGCFWEINLLSVDMKNSLGRQGEQFVVQYIEQLGWKVISKNYHSRFGEIDIIAMDGREIVFIEVKARSNREYGEPQESVDRRKLNKMIKTAQLYLLSKQQENESYRFDLFTLKKSQNGLQIEHFKNIFL